MSDLISRSELIEELKSLKIVLNGKQIFSDDAKDTVLRIVNEQPTAYDIDNVVEELEERTDFLKDCTKYGNKNAAKQEKSYSTMMMYEVADLVDDLIEIVKKGGVSDDVCEWKSDCHLENDNPAEWLISPHNPKRIFSTDIIYCPYCGKKIRVVE